MEGIWAAAPYLHNGSVPTLADLLKPPRNRPDKFEVGNRYDTALVGLAREPGSGSAGAATRAAATRTISSRAKAAAATISEPTSATPTRKPCSNI